MELNSSDREQLSKLTDEMAVLKIDVAVIKANYATKADVMDAKNSVIMWVVGAVLLAQVVPSLIKALTG
jgi:Asp-tRNA(Asn)/Glu-tRNA(Gln) amidotransferase B subunit